LCLGHQPYADPLAANSILESPEELALGWKRTRVFFLPPEFPWPDKANLDIEKKYLKESTEMGIFPKESLGVIDGMFVP